MDDKDLALYRDYHALFAGYKAMYSVFEKLDHTNPNSAEIYFLAYTHIIFVMREDLDLRVPLRQGIQSTLSLENRRVRQTENPTTELKLELEVYAVFVNQVLSLLELHKR